MSNEMCPRSIGGPQLASHWGECRWDDPRNLRSCGHCGSLHQDDFMARLEAGTISLSPTDKSYKVYVYNEGGAKFLRPYRNCHAVQKNPTCTYEDCDHWVTDERDDTKFYFQHLTEEQRLRFVQLYNERKLKWHHPNFADFYVLPFFCRVNQEPTP